MAATMPFMDSQLHAVYHNVELEKNIEFVDHFLETQRHIDKFQLVDLLTNYHRYCYWYCPWKVGIGLTCGVCQHSPGLTRPRH